ncbi:MAG: ABC transporter substrate-binding protein [Candidatus Rokuibacteriota bacterium]|nr:MAG: ABC transporter substrate-binding protein [Candidatus Rokubacteria bacterium]
MFLCGMTLTLGTLSALAAEAQPAKVARIGILTTGDPRSAPPANWEGFLQGLRESGYVEGQNIAFEHRNAQGKPELFPDLAADLARLPVDVIFARGPWAVPAAKAATRTIPIVGIDLESDPVAQGFVKSLARPGGNITGMFLDLAELSGKQLEILKEISPKLARVAVLGDPAINASQLRELRGVARSLAVQIQALEMKSPEDLGEAFEAANKGHAKALIVLSSPLTLRSRTLIGDIAVKRRLPTMYLYRAHVEAGGLISYGPDLPEMFRRCGGYVGRILGGVKPGELPVERPVRFDLVINLKTAKALGLTIPPSLLARADQIIE